MSEKQQAEAQEQAEVAEVSFLEQAIGATKQTPRDETEELLKTLSQEAMKGTVTWDKNLTVTINSAIDAIDRALSNKDTFEEDV